jgi:predicted Zn-ribbon and HTH transcriptional regulator
MPITKSGFEEVDEALHRAVEHEKYAVEQLEIARHEVDRMRKCSECPHLEESLEDVGAAIHTQTRCKDCGFIWTD